MRLTVKDKKVINDFIDRKSIGSHSRRLVTDGHKLDTYGLGGGTLARWSTGNKIVFNDRGTVSEQTVRRYILKLIPPRWIAGESQWALPGRSTQRDSSKKSSRLRPDVLMTRKTYTRTNGGMKVKKSKYRVKSRDPVSTRKTRDEYVLQGNYGYGHGWEDLTAENTLTEIRQRLKEYRENEGGTYRTIKRRVRIARDPQPNVNSVCPVGTQVQTVILSQQFFSQREAESWIRRHGFRLSKIDESRNFWRFRQQPPTRFEEGSFRTIRLRPGVEAVIGCPL